MNYRTRLTVLTCAAITVTLAAASFVTYSLARTEAYAQVDEGLENRIVLTRSFHDLDLRAGGESSRNRLPRAPGGGPGAPGSYSRVLDSTGAEVEEEQPPPPPAAGPGPRIDPSELPERVRDEFRQIDIELPITDAARRLAERETTNLLRETVSVDGSQYRLVSGRVGGYTVQVARPIAETEDFADRLALLLALVTVGGTAISVAAALIVTRAASAPVHRLTELTAAVRESGDLSKRIGVTSNDELGRLARSVNSMLEELERSVVRQQELVDDASHQLRTPLASIRTNMDVLMRARTLDEEMVRDIMSDLSTQVDELTGLVRDLVDLASGVESDVDHGPVRLDAVADEAVRRVRTAFDHVRFDTRLEPAIVIGSEERLVRMVQNLLHNAGKWSSGSDAVVQVEVAGGRVRVVDHGTGVADAEKPRIFERFHRAADARDVPGSGLGLAIVQQVVVDHGGAVRVEDTPGGGATFVVDLPLASETR